MITVLNKSKTDLGFYIGRPSIFGNPFEIGKDGTRSEVIEKYEIYFIQRLESDEKFKKAFSQLITLAHNGDLQLLCWCNPQRCHGDIIKKYIEIEMNIEKMKSIFINR